MIILGSVARTVAKATALGALTLASGCYQVHAAEGGETVRWNIFTGEVATIRNDEFVVAKALDGTAMKTISAAKAWPAIDLPIDDGIKATLTTKYVDGTVLYSVALNRDIKSRYPLATFIIRFYDADGFVVAEKALSVAEMTQIVGDKPLTMLVANGTLPLKAAQYQQVASSSLVWAGFDKPTDQP